MSHRRATAKTSVVLAKLPLTAARRPLTNDATLTTRSCNRRRYSTKVIMDAEIRTIDDRYVLRQLIGKGRLSSVHLASDRQSGDKQVAVKLLDTTEPDAIKLAMFKRESTALKRLDHDNVVNLLHSAWSDEERAFYLVLEYLPYSLDGALQGRFKAQLGDVDRFRVMREIAAALAHAHSETVVHRDIKPSNILFDHSGKAFLADFGLSKILTNLTVGETLGRLWSSGYASPEQRAGGPAELPSDIYSLGAVYFELLSGRTPRPEGPTLDDVQQHIQRRGPLIRLLSLMLAPDPSQRPTASLVASQVTELVRSLEDIPQYHLILTDRAIGQVADLGYSLTADFSGARAAIIEDLGGDQSDEVYIRRDNRSENRYTLFGDSLRLSCTTPDENDALLVIGVDQPYEVTLDNQKAGAKAVRARWEPVQGWFRNDMPSASAGFAKDVLADLVVEVETHERERSVTLERQRDRRDFIQDWTSALMRQKQRIEENAPRFRYSEVEDDGTYLWFTLSNPPPDGLNWTDDQPMAVKESPQARNETLVGIFMSARGSRVQVAKERFVRRRRSGDLPTTGILTTHTGNALAQNQRQQDAVDDFRAGQMANPRLAPVITDPSQSTRRIEPDVTFYQDWLSDDKKDAVRRALASNELFLIQGPPGTGKTSVIAEIVLQILAQNPDARILLTSQSNVAVDHALGSVAAAADEAPSMVRLGLLEKIGQDGTVWTLAERAMAWREEVLARCAPVLTELVDEEGRIRATISAADRQLADGEDTRVEIEAWLEFAREISEELRGDVERYRSMPEGSGLGDEGQASRRMAMADTIIEKRRELEGYITEINRQLPETVRRDCRSNEEMLTALMRAALAPRQQISDTRDPALQLLLKVQERSRILNDWTQVVGLTADFHDLVGRASRVVAATCQYSGSRSAAIHGEDTTYDWAIIDEAGRATVPEVLIPALQADRVIMVGDEQQLPPMIDQMLTLGDTETDDSLATSLFQSLIEQGAGSDLEYTARLRTQYRMHPAIGNLISEVFYGGQLINGTTTLRARGLNWLKTPVTWLSTSPNTDRRETRRATSFANQREAEAVVDFLDKLMEKRSSDDRQMTVGVITAYSAQVDLITTRIDPNNQIRWNGLDIDVATVDSFQGRECDIVIYSTVRSNASRRIGFLSDHRRLNVALSRARQALVIVGDLNVLEHARVTSGESRFPKIIEHVRANPEECSIMDADLLQWL